MVRPFLFGSFCPKSYTSTFVVSPAGIHSRPFFFMLPIFSVFLASIDMMGCSWSCIFRPIMLMWRNCSSPVGMIRPALDVFLVRLQSIALVFQDTSDRFQTYGKATFGNSGSYMGNGVGCPLDNDPFVRLGVGFGFDSIGQARLVLLQLLAA